ncbi:MAG TPA: cytochrome c peroxidase [Polyangiaceae bacterium]|nr:cytochrome c peroxidase [Polyangiaceae bacterium]
MSLTIRILVSGLATASIVGCSSGAVSSDGGSCDIPNVAADRCARAHALSLPEELPSSPGNKYADNPDAAMLGFHLFFDSRVGSGVACVNCHAPELAFTDRASVSVGKSKGTRNAPTIFNAGRLSVMFWDGRADSLWSQPLFAIENEAEMNSTRLQLAHLVFDVQDFKTNYEKAFGPLPDMSGWPAAGKPGSPEFDGLPAATQDSINRVAANVGKAFDAYERLNTTSSASLDKFLQGDATQIIDTAQRGLDVFLAHGCDSCHSGSMLTDQGFHDAKFPSLAGAAPDPGRMAGLAVLESNVFNLKGPYADPGPGVPGIAAPAPHAVSEFRTPPLRNVTRTAPYGHDGALATLPDVLAVHATDLTAEESGQLLAFFETLNGSYPPRPWNNWPSPQ